MFYWRRYSIFKLGLVTYNLAKNWDIPSIIENCSETGFEAIDLRTTQAHGVKPSLGKKQRSITLHFLEK